MEHDIIEDKITEKESTERKDETNLSDGQPKENKLEKEVLVIEDQDKHLDIQNDVSNQQQTKENSSAESEKLIDEALNKSAEVSTKPDDDEPSQNEKVSEVDSGQYDVKNIHYEEGVAIYTDPKSGYQYTWNSELEKWEVKANAYGFEDDTHTYTDTDGLKYFWDKEKGAWFPKINDDFMAQYQMNYGFIDNTNIENKNIPVVVPVAPVSNTKKGEKRKPSTPTWFELDEQKNTKVYVSNLPLDITEEEFVDLMQKYGIIMRDPNSQKLKVKLYTEPNSNVLKGDGLCTYIKIESVELATKLLDGIELRGKKIRVEQAQFHMKGAYDPNLKPKAKKRKEKMKLQKMQEKLFDWRPEKKIGERSKHERVVIVKNVFDPGEFDTEVGLILEYQQDLREESSKCGTVRKVIIFDRHPEGIAQVNMGTPEEADACVLLLNGRWFGQRKLEAQIWDGKTKYRVAETDSQISQRLGGWEKFLEEEPNKEVAKSSSNKEDISEAIDK